MLNYINSYLNNFILSSSELLDKSYHQSYATEFPALVADEL